MTVDTTDESGRIGKKRIFSSEDRRQVDDYLVHDEEIISDRFERVADHRSRLWRSDAAMQPNSIVYHSVVPRFICSTRDFVVARFLHCKPKNRTLDFCP